MAAATSSAPPTTRALETERQDPGDHQQVQSQERGEGRDAESLDHAELGLQVGAQQRRLAGDLANQRAVGQLARGLCS
jgi:hypothetical protein